jgi:hypothetical protein
MSHCAKCASSFVGDACPRCGSAPTVPWRKFDKSVTGAFWVLILGAIVAFFVSMRLLDRLPVLLALLILSVGPLIVRCLAVRGKWGEPHQRSVRMMFRWAALAMVGLIAIIIANSSLDRVPATEIHVYILAKSSHYGKGGPDYLLIVGPSWRVGRDRESLDVGRGTFSRVHIGETVSIDLHPGFFHVPWYNNVSPD